MGPDTVVCGVALLAHTDRCPTGPIWFQCIGLVGEHGLPFDRVFFHLTANAGHAFQGVTVLSLEPARIQSAFGLIATVAKGFS